MNCLYFWRALPIATFVIFATMASAQTPTEVSSLVQSLLEQRCALLNQLYTIQNQGATSEQVAAWHQKNDAQLASLLEQIRAILPQHAILKDNQPVASANASPEIKEFFANQATLIANLPQSSKTRAGEIAPSATGDQNWQKQNADLIKRQATLEQTLTQRGALPLTSPVSRPIPDDVSPQLKAFLSARDSLMKEEMALRIQYRNSDPEAQEEALRKWHQQNAARFSQLQQLAQNLSTNPVSTGIGQSK